MVLTWYESYFEKINITTIQKFLQEVLVHAT